MGPDWTRQPVAELRYDPSDHHWRLYCTDRNSRWHYYDMAEPTTRLDELINEIDTRPHRHLLGLSPYHHTRRRSLLHDDAGRHPS